MSPDRPISILIVEDQSDIRRLIRVAFETHGRARGVSFDIEEASDGASGLYRAREMRPDVVLLDVMMPGGMNGYETCRSIKHDATLTHVHVVMLTARGQATDVQLGMEMGADAYIVKPFRPMELVSRVIGLARG